MKSVGIIAEYNPFHNGHKYLLTKVKQKITADVIVVIMSGNFLQRGVPAIVDKWQRTAVALQNGADLIIELPTEFALQAADYFAKGAINALQRLGVNYLAFGTDIKEKVNYAKFGQKLWEKEAEIAEFLQNSPQTAQNFPLLMTKVYRHFLPDLPLIPNSPNHLLGISYAKENAKYEQPLKLISISRINTNYNEKILPKTGKIASATAIRHNFWQEINIKNFVPMDISRSLAVNWENYFPFLRYKIISTKLPDLAQIYQMQEGLEYRLKEKIVLAKSFSHLMELLKTKRYTYTRIQRLLAYVLLNFSKNELENRQINFPLHILGFNKHGRMFLHQQKKRPNLNLIAKINHKNCANFALTLKTDAIYKIGNKKILEQNYGRKPIFIVKN